MSNTVQTELLELGFLLAQEKCSWLPSQTIKWLGYIWNTEQGKIFVSDDRIEKLSKNINLVLQKVNDGKVLFFVRTLASIVGQIISMSSFQYQISLFLHFGQGVVGNPFWQK